MITNDAAKASESKEIQRLKVNYTILCVRSCVRCALLELLRLALRCLDAAVLLTSTSGYYCEAQGWASCGY
jgi:hypothetical protein